MHAQLRGLSATKSLLGSAIHCNRSKLTHSVCNITILVQNVERAFQMTDQIFRSFHPCPPSPTSSLPPSSPSPILPPLLPPLVLIFPSPPPHSPLPPLKGNSCLTPSRSL